MKYFSNSVVAAVLLLTLSATSHASLVRLDATTKSGLVSSFSVIYDDLNANELFEIGELEEFSGIYFGSRFFDRLGSAPYLVNVSSGSGVYWGFGNPQGEGAGAGYANFSYSTTQINQVPAPGTLGLVGAALAAAGFARRKFRPAG